MSTGQQPDSWTAAVAALFTPGPATPLPPPRTASLSKDDSFEGWDSALEALKSDKIKGGLPRSMEDWQGVVEALKLTQQKVEELEKKFLAEGGKGDVPPTDDEPPKAEDDEFSELWQSRDQYPMIDREAGQPKDADRISKMYSRISFVSA